MIYKASSCSVSLQGAEAMGYIADAQVVDFSSLSNEMQLPVIAYWKESHFVVVYEIGLDYVKFADPAVGSRRLSHENFCKHWLLEDGKTATQGKVLTLFPNRP
jgi:ATP-binding cassette subfamily B protein